MSPVEMVAFLVARRTAREALTRARLFPDPRVLAYVDRVLGSLP
jgi:hypothetical protein